MKFISGGLFAFAIVLLATVLAKTLSQTMPGAAQYPELYQPAIACLLAAIAVQMIWGKPSRQ